MEDKWNSDTKTENENFQSEHQSNSEDGDYSLISKETEIIFESSSDILLYFDTKGRILKANPTAIALSGYKAEEFIGKPFWKISGPFTLKSLKEFLEIYKNTLLGKKTEHFIAPLNDKNGKEHIIDFSSIPIKNEKNKVEKVLLIGHDVTDLKTKKEELQKSEQKLKNLIDLSSEFVWQTDSKGIYSYVSKNAFHTMGYEAEEIIGKTPFDFMDPEEAERVGLLFSEIVEKKDKISRLEDTLINKEGNPVIFETDATPLFDKNGNLEGYFGICRDITKKRVLEQQILNKNKELEQIFSALPDALVYADINRQIIKVNQSFTRIFGYLPDEVLGKKTKILYANQEDFEEQGKQRYNTTAREMYQPYAIQYRRKNGEVFPSETIGTPVRNNNDTVIGLLGLVRDITEQKKAQDNLIKAKQRLETAEKTARIGNVEWYVKEGKGYWSEVMFDLYERDPLLGVPSYDEIMRFHAPKDATRLQEAVENCIQTGQPYDLDLKVQLPSGKIAYHHVIGNPIRNEQGEISSIKGTVQDITDRMVILEELQRSEDNYRTIFNNATDTIFVHDYTDGKIIDVNQTTIDLFGYPKDELLTMDVGKLSVNEAPYTQKEALEWIEKAAKEGPQLFEWKAKNKAGDIIWFENTLQLVQIFGEKRILVTGRNITAQKQTEDELKASEEKYKTYIDSAPDGVFVCNERGEFLEVNESACKITGYTRQELCSMAIPHFCPEGENEAYLNHFTNLKENGYAKAEIRFVRKNGTLGWWSVDAVKLSDTRYLGFVKDITKRKEIEAEIERKNEELKKLNQLKSNFLNVTSHELRTPMTSIVGYLQMLSNKTLGDISEEQRRAIEIVLRNTDRLDRLVDDILDTSRLESGTMKFIPQQTDLAEMIDEVHQTMNSEAHSRNIELILDIAEELPNLIVDPDRIKQVLSNLIKNSIKFSSPHSQIIISAYQENNEIVFRVQDFGRGIPKDHIDKIFEVFYQVDSGVDRSFGGTGLGLTICRGIVIGHGGRIWVESEEEKGSTFCFSLPISPVSDVEGTFGKIDVFHVC